MPKRDYYDDPAAPPANSLVPAVAAVVQDGTGKILLIRRTDNDLYAIPGGAQDIGETVTQAVVREAREETGIEIEVTNLVGIYSDPRHVIAYDNGEVRQEFSICFRAKPIGGQVRTSCESREVVWIEPINLGRLDMHPSVRLRIEHALSGRGNPFYT